MSKSDTQNSMYVNVTNEQLDELRVEINSDRCRSGDKSHLAARLKQLATENGGSFDYRMALLGKTTDLRVIDVLRDLIHIKFDVTVSR